jgi:hypothetical protein
MKSSKQMFYDAHEIVFGRMRHFAEIQNGPNPLTADEIEILAKRLPQRWGWLRGKGSALGRAQQSA